MGISGNATSRIVTAWPERFANRPRPVPPAADNLWRTTGNLTMAQQLLRHESPATTAAYLHPTREELEAALRSLDA